MRRIIPMPTTEDPSLNNTEVLPERRTFTAEYKLRIVEEADAARDPGEVGALLRREGLYSSHLSKWRALRDDGALSGLSRKRGRPPKHSQEELELIRLQRENLRLREELRKAELIIDVQKKLSEFLASKPLKTESGS